MAQRPTTKALRAARSILERVSELVELLETADARTGKPDPSKRRPTKGAKVAK